MIVLFFQTTVTNARAVKIIKRQYIWSDYVDFAKDIKSELSKYNMPYGIHS